MWTDLFIVTSQSLRFLFPCTVLSPLVVVLYYDAISSSLLHNVSYVHIIVCSFYRHGHVRLSAARACLIRGRGRVEAYAHARE